jgi:D-xylose transport system substrate-binding protein
MGRCRSAAPPDPPHAERSPAARPTTGQDAELAAVQRILDGEQYMTVYKAIKPEAEQAAELAVDLVDGDRSAADGLAKETTANGSKNVPSIILTPVAVTKANAKRLTGARAVPAAYR